MIASDANAHKLGRYPTFFNVEPCFIAPEELVSHGTSSVSSRVGKNQVVYINANLEANAFLFLPKDIGLSFGTSEILGGHLFGVGN